MIRIRTLQFLLLFVSVLGFGQTDHYLSGRACMEGGLYDSAVYRLEQALEQNSGSTDIYYQLGISYFTLKRFPDARDMFYETEKGVKGWGVSTWPKAKSS